MTVAILALVLFALPPFTLGWLLGRRGERKWWVRAVAQRKVLILSENSRLIPALIAEEEIQEAAGAAPRGGENVVEGPWENSG